MAEVYLPEPNGLVFPAASSVGPIYRANREAITIARRLPLCQLCSAILSSPLMTTSFLSSAGLDRTIITSGHQMIITGDPDRAMVAY